MEYFGITLYGPQNYIKDVMKEGYKEPVNNDEVVAVMQKTLDNSSTCPKTFERPDVDVIRTIDCYMGRVNGFAYGSTQRFNKMKVKGLMKPVGPPDMYRLPPTTSMEYGWFLCDPVITSTTWHITNPRYPQPISPNSHILDIVKKNNKYASLF